VSDLEAAFDTHWTRLAPKDAPAPVAQYRFEPGRKWAFDRAWPSLNHMVAVELDGGVWTSGRHTRGQGFVNDCTKLNMATVRGWRVLRFTSTHLEQDPQGCIDQVLRLLGL
jgi:hypothetical protein